MIKWSQMAQKIVPFSGVNAAAGTVFTVAHGLGYAPTLTAIRVGATADAAATDNANIFAVVSADNTNVTLKPGRTINPSSGVIYIALEEMGPANSARR